MIQSEFRALFPPLLSNSQSVPLLGTILQPSWDCSLGSFRTGSDSGREAFLCMSERGNLRPGGKSVCGIWRRLTHRPLRPPRPQDSEYECFPSSECCRVVQVQVQVAANFPTPECEVEDEKKSCCPCCLSSHSSSPYITSSLCPQNTCRPSPSRRGNPLPSRTRTDADADGPGPLFNSSLGSSSSFAPPLRGDH